VLQDRITGMIGSITRHGKGLVLTVGEGPIQAPYPCSWSCSGGPRGVGADGT
jgi:hypothetical protein